MTIHTQTHRVNLMIVDRMHKLSLKNSLDRSILIGHFDRKRGDTSLPPSLPPTLIQELKSYQTQMALIHHLSFLVLFEGKTLPSVLCHFPFD